MRHERYSRRNFGIAFRIADAARESLEPSLVNADVFVVGKSPEKLVRVVAVFACALPQVEGCGLIERKEFRHAVRVVVMRVAQHADIHLREVDAHHFRVFCEQVRCARVEQHLVAVIFHINGKSPLAE